MLYSIRTVTVSAFRIFIALKPNPCLLTSSLNSCFKTHTAQLHNSSPFATRFRNHRRANGSQQRTTGKALLDKFVKHLSLDGGNLVTNSLYICLQEPRIISFSVVNMTEKFTIINGLKITLISNVSS